MRRILADMSRAVLISLAVIVLAIVIFAVAFPVLGGALDDAQIRNSKLKSDIEQSGKIVAQAKQDQAYVHDHQQEFESLINSDRLVPHTRRAAIVELQKVARIHGLSALNYAFSAATSNSLKAVESQPQSGAYSVSVEDIDLKVGAPFDGPVYNFISDVNEAFPGSLVIDALELRRAPEILPLALELVSRGEDSQIVTGSIKLSWRTAQAREKATAEAGK